MAEPNSADDKAPAYVPAPPKIVTAEPKKIEEPTLPPKKAKPDAAPKTEAKPTAKKTAGFDLFRPFRYLWGFTAGTIEDTLDGISTGGRRGFWLGGAVGILLCLGGAGLPVLMATVALGAMGGILFGGSAGLIAGGVNGVTREMRKEKGTAPASPTPSKPVKKSNRITGPSFSDYDEAQDKRDLVNYDRYRQQSAENSRDYSTYWQDMVSEPRHGGPGKGL